MALRIIIVGLGSIGRRHVRILAANQRVTVELCDENPAMIERAIVESGVRSAYSSFAEALQSQPELMLIATPHTLHADQAVAALDRGIHVLCEKPMSDTLEDARRMLAAADRSEAVMSVGFMNHFRPGVVRLKELVESGHFGQILQFKFHVGTYVTLVNSVSRYQDGLEGALLMDYAHQPDLMCWLLGVKPVGAYMAGTTGGDLTYTSNPSSLFVVMDYDRPLISCLSLNYLQMPQRDDCEIIGDRGWALWDTPRQIIRLGRRNGDDASAASLWEEAVPDVGDELYHREHERFLDAVEGICRPESPPKEAIAANEVIDAALRSWRTGSRVEL